MTLVMWNYTHEHNLASIINYHQVSPCFWLIWFGHLESSTFPNMEGFTKYREVLDFPNWSNQGGSWHSPTHSNSKMLDIMWTIYWQTSKLTQILVENPVAEFIAASNVRRRWQWMKFSRALEKFLEVELFSEGPGWRAREALTCPHISGKMPFQGSLVVRMELELLGLLEPLWQFGRAADCHATLNHDYSIDI